MRQQNDEAPTLLLTLLFIRSIPLVNTCRVRGCVPSVQSTSAQYCPNGRPAQRMSSLLGNLPFFPHFVPVCLRNLRTTVPYTITPSRSSPSPPVPPRTLLTETVRQLLYPSPLQEGPLSSRVGPPSGPGPVSNMQILCSPLAPWSVYSTYHVHTRTCS
jgi:hypothetical protein